MRVPTDVLAVPSVEMHTTERCGVRRESPPELTFSRRDRGDSASLSCVSCGSGWSVPCVSIQLTPSHKSQVFPSDATAVTAPVCPVFRVVVLARVGTLRCVYRFNCLPFLKFFRFQTKALSGPV